MELTYRLEDESYKYVYGSYMVPNKKQSPLFPKQYCCKNDWAVAQLILRADVAMQVNVSGEACFYPKGALDEIRVAVDVPGIDPSQINVQLVGLIKDDDHQYKSDLLMDEGNIFIEAEKEQAIWIQINVGEDIKPATYNASIKLYHKNLFEDETLKGETSFELDVMDMALDDPKDYTFHLDLWQHNSNIARKYQVPLWSNAHFAIIENYVKSLAELGQKAVTLVVSEVPWSGQNSMYDKINPSNFYEYNMVQLTLEETDNWVYDFSVLDRYLDLCAAYGIDKEIEVFGLINIWLAEDAGFGKVIEDASDAIRLRYYDAAQGTYRYMRKKADLASYVKALEGFFRKKGVLERVRLLADEPSDLDVFMDKINEMKALAPGFHYKVAINHIAFMGKNIPHVVDYCPSLTCACDKYDELVDVQKNVNGSVTYYVCCVQAYPNTFLRSPAIESRIIPWIAWVLGLAGFLRWNYTVWPDDPINHLSVHYPNWPAGDTNFVYPGKNGSPMLTIRYMNLKRGIRDYEIIRQYVRQYNAHEEVNHLLKKVFYWEHTADMNHKQPKDLYAFEQQAYNNIIHHMLTKLSADS